MRHGARRISPLNSCDFYEGTRVLDGANGCGTVPPDCIRTVPKRTVERRCSCPASLETPNV